MVFASTCLLLQNLTDRNKYPEGDLCLYCWSYWAAGVVCGTLSIYAIRLADKKTISASEDLIGSRCAASSLIVAGIMLFGWSVYGSGK